MTFLVTNRGVAGDFPKGIWLCFSSSLVCSELLIQLPWTPDMSSAVHALAGLHQILTPTESAPGRREELAIEAICELGCQEVHRVIQRMERGEHVAETAGLSGLERERVLDEIKDVMSVYGTRCAIR